MAASLPSPTDCCQRCCPDTLVEVPAGGMLAFDTKVELRAYTDYTDRMFVAVLGGVTLGDGDGGQYYFDSASTAVDDDGVTIRPNDITAAQPGRWRMFGS